MDDVVIRDLVGGDRAPWAAARAELYGDSLEAQTEGIQELLADRRAAAFGAFTDGRLIGFAEATIRSHVDGATGRDVGYLEGWWVEPDHRGRGVGRRLLAAVETWAIARGCRELGSDTWADDAAARAAHRAAGFREVDVVAQFLKPLPAPEPVAAVAEPPQGPVTLRDVTADNLRAIVDLEVAPRQDQFVAPNGISVAQAMFTDDRTMWGIYVGDTPIGFALLSHRGDPPRAYLWRFMIDRRYQRLGFGREAMLRIIEHVQTHLATDELYLSYVPHPEGPGDFYRSLGFVETGVEQDGEREMVLHLR